MKIELSTEIARFQEDASENSKTYAIQDYVLNERPVYYNKQNKRYVYATKKGVWVVISNIILYQYIVITN